MLFILFDGDLLPSAIECMHYEDLPGCRRRVGGMAVSKRCCRFKVLTDEFLIRKVASLIALSSTQGFESVLAIARIMFLYQMWRQMDV